MKLLSFQAADFRFSESSLDQLPAPGEAATEVLVVFVHAEPDDERRLNDLVRKAAKHIKWHANKRAIRRVALHSFAHLAESKAAPEVAESFIGALGERLGGGGYAVEQTPFGASCSWLLAVHQEPIAKVFKSL